METQISFEFPLKQIQGSSRKAAQYVKRDVFGFSANNSYCLFVKNIETIL